MTDGRGRDRKRTRGGLELPLSPAAWNAQSAVSGGNERSWAIGRLPEHMKSSHAWKEKRICHRAVPTPMGGVIWEKPWRLSRDDPSGITCCGVGCRLPDGVASHSGRRMPTVIGSGGAIGAARPLRRRGECARHKRVSGDLHGWIHPALRPKPIGSCGAVARLTSSATRSRTVLNVAPTGRKISFGTIDISRAQDGKLAEHWDLVDTAGIQKQLHGE